MRFDTDYVETRRVHNIVPFIAVDGVRYSVPPNALGQLVEIRRRVDADEFDGPLGRHASSPPTGSRPAGATRCGTPSIAPPPKPIALGRHRSRRDAICTSSPTTTTNRVAAAARAR